MTEPSYWWGNCRSLLGEKPDAEQNHSTTRAVTTEDCPGSHSGQGRVTPASWGVCHEHTPQFLSLGPDAR